MTVYSMLIPKTENEGYGIKVVSERLVYDISYNYTAVKQLCEKCNEFKVDPVHFDSVLEDFLSRKEDL